jgi:hypothetical protein
MVEIEISVLREQCLDRRTGDDAVLNTEVAAWQRQRNASGARIRLRFTTQKARHKLAHADRRRNYAMSLLCPTRLSLFHRRRVERCPLDYFSSGHSMG